MADHKEIENTEAAICGFLSSFSKEVLRPLFPFREEADMAETLLNEALLNAWEHGNQKDPQRRIGIVWRVFPANALEITVRDEGAGFTPPDLARPPPVSHRRGRGLFILKEFADCVRFNERGNEITFIYRGKKWKENIFKDS